ncbi:MAG: S-layer homology domain-containing protein, partial [Candidatus Gracilibacteria bacterium]
DSSGLVSGAVYTFAFNATDDAGNAATAVSRTAVTFDTTAPTAAITYSKDAGVTYASTESVRNANTLIIKATFNEPMADSPVVKIAVDNAVLSATAMTKVSTTEYTYDLDVPAGNIATATVSMSIGTDVAENVITAVPTSGSTFTIDNTAPTLAEVLAVPSSTIDSTPNYTFSSDEAGTITYSGSCLSLTTSAISGDNTITFQSMSLGTHSGCTILVTDATGNAGTALGINSFTITTGGSGVIFNTQPTQNNQPAQPAQQPQTQPVAQALFTDTQNHWAETYIEKLQQKCDVQGYKDANGNLLNEYRPNDTISRAELVKIVMQCQFPTLPAATENPFFDVHTTDWFSAAVSKAKSLGVVVGSKNYFLPFNQITRAEALKVVLATIYADQEIHGNALTFTDVSATAWYYRYISFAVDHSFISGYVDGQGNPLNLFGPNNNLTRGEAAKIIVRVFAF